MKAQTFIAFFETAGGEKVTFERFSCKRISTVESHIFKLWDNSLYRACTKEAEMVTVYATPNGIDKESEPCSILKLPR